MDLVWCQYAMHPYIMTACFRVFGSQSVRSNMQTCSTVKPPIVDPPVQDRPLVQDRSQYNRPPYKGHRSRSQTLIVLPIVLIHFEPPKEDNVAEFILPPICPLFGGSTVYQSTRLNVFLTGRSPWKPLTSINFNLQSSWIMSRAQVKHVHFFSNTMCTDLEYTVAGWGWKRGSPHYEARGRPMQSLLWSLPFDLKIYRTQAAMVSK